ncbi:MAG: tryptophan synthase subunit beta, partial [Fusobacteriaceae bacterium]|nr:tryptophan synthase subunit beta [Fusobacteriaceae bacterium]
MENIKKRFNSELPNENGYFGEYGGSFIPPDLEKIMKEISTEYQKAINDESFLKELNDLYKYYVGRPSPIFHALNLSKKYGAEIYFKREDLNHTGAHKINHCLGE